MDSARLRIGIFAFIFLLFLVPSLIAISSPRSLDILKTKFALIFQEPKVTKIDKQISEIRQEQHPSLYFIDLEYDPKTEKVAKKASGYFNGDLPSLKSEVTFLPETFTFRIEAISPANEIVLSGWESLYKSVILTEDGKYVFRVSIPYVAGETLNVYSIGYQKLWEEKVK